MDVPVRSLAEPIDENPGHHQVADGDHAALRAGHRLRQRLHPGPDPQAEVRHGVHPQRPGRRDGQADQQQAEAGEAPLGTLTLELLPAGEVLHLRTAVKEHGPSLDSCGPKAGGR